MMLKKLVAGSIATALTVGAFSHVTTEASVAAPMKPAVKLLVCKKGEVAYKVKVGHHHVWRCHAAPHHVMKPLAHKKPLPPKKP